MNDLYEIIINETPAHWRVVPFWSLYRKVKITGFPEQELLSVYRDYGVIPKSSRDDNRNVESDDLSGYQLVKKRWLVTNKMKAWQGSIAVSKFQGIVSPAYFVYEPLHQENDEYIHFLLRSHLYTSIYGRISKGVRIGQWDLEHEALRTVPIALPPVSEQTDIVENIRAEIKKIDALIDTAGGLKAAMSSRSGALLSLLLEKKFSLINYRVTGQIGLFEDSPQTVAGGV